MMRRCTYKGTSCCQTVLLAVLLTAGCNAQSSWDFRNARDPDSARLKASNDPNFFVFSNMPRNPKSSSPEPKTTLQDQFNDWARAFSYTFNGNQAQQAMQNFRNNMQRVFEINTDPNQRFWASGNAFSHLTWEQFRSTYLMQPSSRLGITLGSQAQNITTFASATRGSSSSDRPPLMGAASEVDWVAAGKVPPIRDQGSCGSCWAFAATAAIESMYLIKVGGSVGTINLSEQQLVSCCTSANGCRWSSGCNGGLSDEAINYVSRAAQTTEARYPYTRTTGNCNNGIVGTTTNGQGVQLRGSAVRVTPNNNENALKEAVSTAPTVIYFEATNSFMYYAGGIYAANDCGSDTNHAMVAVGYSNSGGYWVIRNSWGTGWGEAGYAKVAFKGDGLGPCGMYDYSYLPPQEFTMTLNPNPGPNPTPSPTPTPSPSPSPRPSATCEWYLGDRTTRVSLTGDTSNCGSCFNGCRVHPTCIYYRWMGGSQTYYSDGATCGIVPTPSPVPSPVPTPSPSPDGNAICRWYLGDRTTRVALTGDTSACGGCFEQCRIHPTCIYYSWNGGSQTYYSLSSCGASPSPRSSPRPSPRPSPTPSPQPSGNCRWFRSDRLPMATAGDTSTCFNCYDNCRTNSYCIYYTWNGGSQQYYSNNACR